MKHLGKIASLILALIMAASIAIGIGVIFAVRNVNVTLLSYSVGQDGVNGEISSVKDGVMQKCKGRVISFVSEEDVLDCLGEGYTLESFEKVLPCTLNLTVKQRREVFAVSNGDVYDMYDENGVFMRTADENVNYVDNSPNVLVEDAENAEDMKKIADVCAVFQSPSNFAALRSVVEKVVLYKPQTDISLDRDKITFLLRSGLSLEVQDYTVSTVEKISKAYKYFDGLSGENKLSGKIYAFADENGAVVVTHDLNG